MPFTKIIRKTIIDSNSSELREILELDQAEGNLNFPTLSFQKNGSSTNLHLEFKEKDIFSKTYITALPSGQKVRVIIFEGSRADEFKKQYNALEYFSIGSLSQTGFGIFFILTNQNETIINTVNTSTLEYVQQLLMGANMQLMLLSSMAGYIEIIEKIPAIASPSVVKQIPSWASVLDIAIENKIHFSAKTQKWLSEF